MLTIELHVTKWTLENACQETSKIVKHRLMFISLLLLALLMALAPADRASTAWYVDAVNGSDSNNCMSLHEPPSQAHFAETGDEAV